LHQADAGFTVPSEVEGEGKAMSTDLPWLARGALRRCDSNSLLRMYDQANEVLRKSPSQRERADRARGRIADELRRRNVPL
jgi:hypothetical protein